MRALITRKVPGSNCAGRLRFEPWRAMYCMSPCQPAASHSCRWRSSSSNATPLMPMSENPSARAWSASCARRASGSGGRSWLLIGSILGPYNNSMGQSQALYSVAQVRALDAYAIAQLGVPAYTLMRRAGEAALRALRTRWPTAGRIAVVCGGGNNGGDGYVVARYARAAGLEVSVFALNDPEQLRGDARRAADEFRASGAQVSPWTEAHLGDAEVLVDALLGT